MSLFSKEEIYALEQLGAWLQDSADGSDPETGDFWGPHFDNEGKIYATHVIDAYNKLMEIPLVSL